MEDVLVNVNVNMSHESITATTPVLALHRSHPNLSFNVEISLTFLFHTQRGMSYTTEDLVFLTKIKFCSRK